MDRSAFLLLAYSLKLSFLGQPKISPTKGRKYDNNMTFYKSRILLVSEIIVLLFSFMFSDIAHADNSVKGADSYEISKLLKSKTEKKDIKEGHKKTKESVRVSLNEEEYVKHIGAPPGHHFPVTSVVKGKPEATAKNFLFEYGNAFGIKSKMVDFETLKVKTKNDRNYVRFQQVYADTPVFGAEVIVQLDTEDGVESVLSDIMRDTAILDDGQLSLNPKVSSLYATKIAEDQIMVEHPIARLISTEPSLMIYEPSVVGSQGKIRLVWHMIVRSTEGSLVDEVVLVDAHTGEIPLHFSQINHSLNRMVYDANNTDADPGTLERSETKTSSNVTDANTVFTFLGDTYNFYLNKNGRDSADDNGATISATVQYCDPGDVSCPETWYNAKHMGDRLYFGNRITADDVVAHEYTHWVTSNESNLNYFYESGAINEALSDIWGTFIDFENGGGDWLIGEDLPEGALRNMQDPPNPPSPCDFPNCWQGENPRQPDRKSQKQFGDCLLPLASNDKCGVHINSGIINKLAYLLINGDTFNGYTINGMSIPKIADIFYEVQTNLLSSSADFTDLYNQLIQAAINLNWAATEQGNLQDACLAVEIPHSIIDVEKNALVLNNWGTVDVTIFTNENTDYYVRVWDDNGLTGPNWQWTNVSSPVLTLPAFQKHTFTFYVKPDTLSEGFEFWLYKKDALGLYKIIHKVQVTLTVAQLPTISSVTPSSARSGDSVTIAGINFGISTGTVYFGSYTASVSSWSDTSITVKAPFGSGTVDVKVRDYYGNITTKTGAFTFNDSSTLPSVTISATDNTATEAGSTTGYYTVSRTGSTTSSLTVYYSKTGTAISGTDYSSLSGSVTIPAGSSSTTITVTPIDDTAVEGSETVILTITSNSAYTIGSPGSATVTITDNDSSTCTGDFGEPNESFSAAYTVNTGNTYTAKICSSTDKDYYKFIPSSSGTVTITQTSPIGKDYDISLYNSSQNQMMDCTLAGAGNQDVCYTAVTAGQTYYIKIFGFSGAYSTTSTYSLSLSVPR